MAQEKTPTTGSGRGGRIPSGASGRRARGSASSAAPRSEAERDAAVHRRCELAGRGTIDDAEGRTADVIDGSIGEASMFHATFGYYAHGVVETTAVLPAGWRERLMRYQTPATSGVVAWCLEPHDLWISKAIAGREKDLEFCTALLFLGVVERGELTRRLALVGSLDPRLSTLVQARIDR